MKKKENRYLIFDTAKKLGIRNFLKYCLNLIDRIVYKIKYYLFKPNISYSNCKYDVSICAIFKNEADYLKEWIEFHRIIGINHFYLYNNQSSDNYFDVLLPYINEGIVTLKDWPKPQSQMSAYQDFMSNYKSDTKWVGFIDLDEYVVPNKFDNIYDFLKKFDNNRPAILIYWKCFGTSGFRTRNVTGLITEDFVVSWHKYVDIGKFFFNTSYGYIPDYKRNNYMHYMWAECRNIKMPPVNVFDKVCTWGVNPMSSGEVPIQMNHYLIKSFDEYTQKKAKRGGGVHPPGMHDYDYFYQHEMKCCDVDYHAYKYLIKLKLAMEGRAAK